VPLLKRLPLLAFTLALLALVPSAPALAGMPVRVGVHNFEPLLSSEHGHAQGFFVDMLRDTAEREHWELIFVPGAWDECLERLKSGQIDLLPGMAQTTERDQDFRFSEDFLFVDWGLIYKKRGAAIHTVFDLEGKTITALEGSSITRSLQSLLEQFGITARVVTRHEYSDVLAAVGRGEADAGVCLNVVGNALDHKYKVERTDIVFAPEKLRYAVKRGGREDLLPPLDRHLADLKAQPESLYYSLRDRWLGLAREPMLPRWAAWTIGAGLAGLGLLAAFVLFLRFMVRRRTRELAASEARFRNIVETANEGVWMVDGGYRTTYVNNTMAAMLGYRPEEMLGRPPEDFLFPEDLADHAERVAQRRGGEDEVYERRHRRKDGGVLWGLLSLKSLRDDQGGFAGALAMVTDITARKQAEQALQQSEAFIRAVMENLPIGISVNSVTPWVVFEYMNENFLTLYRTTRERIASAGGFFEAVYEDPEFREQMRRRVQDDCASGDPERMSWVDVPITRAGEETTYVTARNTSLPGRGLMISTVWDVTHRKRAERELLKSRELYRAMVDDQTELVSRFSADGTLLFVNQGFCRFFGKPREELLGARWTPAVLEEDLPAVRAQLARLSPENPLVTVENRTRNGDGEVRWLQFINRAFFEESGALREIQSVGRDITAQKELEARLRESELHFRTLAGSGQAVIWTSGPDMLCDYFNEPWLAFTGRTLEQELGNGWTEGVHPDDFARCLEVYVTAFDRRESFSMEYRLRHASGEYRWIVDQGTPRYGTRGEFLGYIGHCLDISELKRAEESLVAARDAAEAANRAKGEFLANMSHELRTPMNGVLGMLQLLKLEELTPGQQDYASNAFEAANRLLSLLNDVLDFSRIEAGVLTFRQEPYKPADILAATDDVFGHICSRKGLALRFEPDPSLPAALSGDEARIRQILFNLVGNAVKFTRAGSVRVEAWHRIHDGTGRLYIAVTDTGVGIPEDKLGSVFDRFSQADGSYTRQFEGAGLGLAIVRRIVEALDGSLCIDSEPGHGTAMVLTLPAPVASAEALSEDRTRRPAPEEATPLRILLAEDELIGQLGARLMLERMGHSVTAVGDGRSAVEAAFKEDYDCVLMDIQMPEMDGVEATRILRNTCLPGQRRIVIVAMTAYALSGDREKFLAAGMDEYISKPFQQEELRSLLQAVAQKRRESCPD